MAPLQRPLELPQEPLEHPEGSPEPHIGLIEPPGDHKNLLEHPLETPQWPRCLYKDHWFFLKNFWNILRNHWNLPIVHVETSLDSFVLSFCFRPPGVPGWFDSSDLTSSLLYLVKQITVNLRVIVPGSSPSYNSEFINVCLCLR